jgi:hypothetical protein
MTAPTTTVTDRVVDAYLGGDADALADLCAPDVLVDLVLPQWRFQMTGRETLRSGVAQEEFLPGRRVAWHHRTDTADGVLLELETWAPMEGEDRKWLELNKFRVADGQVVELVQYCSGIWDAATIARQAVEAPMVRER